MTGLLDVVGAAEIGEMLGVGRQRVYQLTTRPDFPRPCMNLKMGKGWYRADVEAWQRQRTDRHRKPPAAAGGAAQAS